MVALRVAGKGGCGKDGKVPFISEAGGESSGQQGDVQRPDPVVHGFELSC